MPSERLFSTTGDVISEHCDRFLPENTEIMNFLKYNNWCLLRFTAVTVHLQYTAVKLTHFTVEF